MLKGKRELMSVLSILFFLLTSASLMTARAEGATKSSDKNYSSGPCTIQGSSGACGVFPFIGSEKSLDHDAHTCTKFSGVTYDGFCKNGLLQGIALLKRGNQSSIIGAFSEGRIFPPYADIWNWGIGITNEEGVGEGCVNFTTDKGPWDHSATPPCNQLADFSPGFFTQDNWESIRLGQYDYVTRSCDPIVEKMAAIFMDAMNNDDIAKARRYVDEDTASSLDEMVKVGKIAHFPSYRILSCEVNKGSGGLEAKVDYMTSESAGVELNLYLVKTNGANLWKIQSQMK